MKLDCIATDCAALAQHSATTDSSMADFFEQLLQAELGAREQRKRQVLTKLAALPGVKTLEQYDFGFASGVLFVRADATVSKGSGHDWTHRDAQEQCTKMAYES
ncbi:ATP-binding protein [Paraburkholderia sediminicola]